ncbi:MULTISPECIES: hypothetical protein [Oscillospiraceae]|uniref:hypothetical protein n=1 Tax=Oscillospiraceae TaxID=216572 RepID=UPI000B368B18|nr:MULTISPECIES: hypothetical protein [Oscillospiraceae]MBM6722670.1 hypothetical protein [Pseudoflavonifractor phocaeensis]OUN22903.1 hypothetical protein B5G34_05750 [Flavonifractor sp. An82]
MLENLFVWNTDLSEKISATITPATSDDLKQTMDWQTQWTSRAAREMPNKVALRRRDNAELLGLMSYELDEKGLAVEIIYLESAGHSNANLLHTKGGQKKYIGIAKALFAYAASVSVEAGFGGVLFFKAKTSELREYYIREFGAMPLGSYDPFRLIIWEDAAERIISEYQ